MQKRLFSIAVIIIVLVLAQFAFAQNTVNVNLAWDANTDHDANTNYDVHACDAPIPTDLSCASGLQSFDMGNGNLSGSIAYDTALTSGTVFMRATANDGTNTSDPSNEVNQAFDFGSPTVFSPIMPYGDAANWNERTPSRWDVIDDGGDKRYAITTSSYSSQSGSRLGEHSTFPENWGDFVINVDLKANENFGSNPNADKAVIWGFIDNSNYNHVLFNANPTFGMEVFQVQGGSRTTIFTHPTFGIPDNGFHSVEITRIGDNVVIKYDGVELADLTDTRLGGVGHVGIGSHNDSAYFDNFNVQAPAVQQVAVPDVIGLQQATAEANIVAAQLVVGTVTQVNDPAPVGEVIGQSPIDGTMVNIGSAVDITVSLGPGQITVPDVLGLTEAAASSAITSAGLVVGTVTKVFTHITQPSVILGTVAFQNPAGGTQVSSGTAVDLDISSTVEELILQHEQNFHP